MPADAGTVSSRWHLVFPMRHFRNKAATVKLPPPAVLEAQFRQSVMERLRAEYEVLGSEPIPAQQVDLLLALRNKERDRKRRA